MKEQYENLLMTSLMLYVDHKISVKGEAYTNHTGVFYPIENLYNNVYTYSCPYKQLVCDSGIASQVSVTSPDLMSGIYINDDWRKPFSVEINAWTAFGINVEKWKEFIEPTDKWIDNVFLNTIERAHTGLDDLIVVNDLHERKRMMIEGVDGVVSLPGGIGTFEELLEAMTWKRLGLHPLPIVLVNTNNYFEPLMFIKERMVEIVAVADINQLHTMRQ